MADVLEGGARYIVHHRLGAGGMGVVHLGEMVTPAGTRKIAIKQLLTRAGSARQGEGSRGRAEGGETGRSPEEDRMIAEARLVFQLQHPNICQVLDLATNEEGTFIVMEFIDGCDLKALIARSREEGDTIEVAAAIFIAREVADALDYAHRRKDDRGGALWLVHGDVTPQNILLSREGDVKLADFGIARALSHAPGNQLVAGTPGFMAPETFTGTTDQRADIYSLGVCLYVTLSGMSPQSDGLNVETLLQHRAEISPELAAILERALATRPEDRYATIGEFKRALANYLLQRHPTFSRESLAEIVQRRNRESVLLIEESLSLLSLTGTATFLSNGSPFSKPAQSASISLASPHGTERASRHRSRKKRPWLIAAAIGALALSTIPLRRLLQPKVRATAVPETIIDKKIDHAPEAAPVAQKAPKPVEAPVTDEPPRAQRKAHVAKSVGSQAQPQELGALTVNAEPWGAVFVDGRRFADQTPVYNAPIAAGKHSVSIYSPILHRYSPPRTLSIQPHKHYDLGFDWK